MEPTVQRQPREETQCAVEIEQRAFTLIDAHARFLGRARRFEFCFREDVLVVRGNVPSYYMKQVLQSVLSNMDGVRFVDNQVTVISSESFAKPFRD